MADFWLQDNLVNVVNTFFKRAASGLDGVASVELDGGDVPMYANKRLVLDFRGTVGDEATYEVESSLLASLANFLNQGGEVWILTSDSMDTLNTHFVSPITEFLHVGAWSRLTLYTGTGMTETTFSDDGMADQRSFFVASQLPLNGQHYDAVYNIIRETAKEMQFHVRDFTRTADEYGESAFVAWFTIQDPSKDDGQNILSIYCQYTISFYIVSTVTDSTFKKEDSALFFQAIGDKIAKLDVAKNRGLAVQPGTVTLMYVSKAHVLKQALEESDKSPHMDIVYIGDGGNDLPVIRHPKEFLGLCHSFRTVWVGRDVSDVVESDEIKAWPQEENRGPTLTRKVVDELMSEWTQKEDDPAQKQSE